jgi:hypothetical protein
MSDVGTAGTSGSEQATAGDTAGGTPAGWYPDPQGAMRWWDGSAWTSHVAAGAATSVSRTATILSTPGPAAPPGASTSRLPRLGSLPAPPQLSRRTWVVVGAVAAVLVLLAGYLLFGRGGDDAATTAGPVGHTSTPQQVVEQVALKTTDLKGGLRVSLVKGGQSVKGATGDLLCGYRGGTSDAHRVARQDVMVVTAKGQPIGLENEVVAYDSPASAAKAMAELQTALARCPHTYVPLTVGGPAVALFSHVRTHVQTGGPASGMPYDQLLFSMFTTTLKSPRAVAYDTFVVARRGSVVTTMALVSPTPITAQMQEPTVLLANVTIRRLPAS